MDQIKIGKFISQMRKEHGLTQRQLAQKLNISDKTVSKWETGKGLPEVSVMLPLCEILGISVNDLLSGEKLSTENYKSKAEENIMNLVKEKEESRKKIIISAVIAFLCTAVLIVCILTASYAEGISSNLKTSLTIFGFAVFITGIALAVILDREAGSFECPACKARFTPTMYEYIMGAHTLTKRKLKCPNCGQTHYCKHRLTK